MAQVARRKRRSVIVTPPEKRRAVVESLLQGGSVVSVASAHRVDRRSVNRWLELETKAETDRMIEALKQIEAALQDAEQAVAVASQTLKALRSIRWKLIDQGRVTE